MPKTNTLDQFLVDRNNFYNTKMGQESIPDLEDGEALIKVVKYAFTTNNITYAIVGENLKYWDFFPVSAPWGIIPVWGYGEVQQSNHPEIAVGEMFYGYFPMASHLKVKAGKVSPFGFTDVAEHRQAMAPVYSYYTRVSSDPSYQSDHQDYQPILRPLFFTSYLSNYFLLVMSTNPQMLNYLASSLA